MIPRILILLTLPLLSGCLEENNLLPSPSGDSRERNYAEIRPVFWEELYPHGGETIYCGERFGSQHGRDINIEHVFPMSWVTKALQCGEREQCRANSQRFNTIEADMHNLYPSRADINKARGSMAYAELDGEKHYSPGCDFEIDRRRYLAEPAPGSRGEIARAMLYMAETYPELQLFRRQRDLLEQWHRDDPADQLEKTRNRRIEQLQGNSNTFIR